MKDSPATARPTGAPAGHRSAIKLFVGAVAVPLVLIAGLGLMQGAEEESSVGARAGAVLVVNTIVARTETSIEETRSFTGVVKATRTSELSFDRAGRVVRLLVSEGDVVEAGQAIAQLDQRRLEAKKKTLDDALKRARTALDALDPTAQAMTNAQQQAKLSQLRAELDRLQQDLSARTRAAAGQPASNQFIERLNNVERQLAIVNQTSRRQKIDAQTKRIAELEGQLKDLDLELEGGTLEAPFDGIVALRHVSEGTVVSPGMPVVRLVERGSLEAWVGIPVELASQVPIDQQVLLTIGDQDYAASVKAKLPQLDRTTRTRTVVMKLDAAAADQLMPGEVARVQVRTEKPMSGIWLPLSALDREVRGLWSVMVVEGEAGRQTVSRRIVELLHVANKRALVRGTLEDGDLVIANGTHRVVPGQRVTSKDASAAFSSAGPDPGSSQ